jgi:hypothetical protein
MPNRERLPQWARELIATLEFDNSRLANEVMLLSDKPSQIWVETMIGSERSKVVPLYLPSHVRTVNFRAISRADICLPDGGYDLSVTVPTTPGEIRIYTDAHGRVDHALVPQAANCYYLRQIPRDAMFEPRCTEVMRVKPKREAACVLGANDET